MFKRIALLTAVCLVSLPQAANAQSDPFLSDLEENTFAEPLTGRVQQQDEGTVFSGPMEKLLNMAGENQKADVDHWSKVKKAPTNSIKSDPTFNMIMRQEAARPLDRRERDTLQELQEELKDSSAKRKLKAEEDYFRGIR